MKQLLDFTGKVVLVTGARSGIGKATAIAFAERGAQVVVAGRRPCDETEAEIAALGGSSKFIKCDVAVEDEVKALIDEIMDTYGHLDAAVNAAGYGAPPFELVDVTTEGYDKVFDIDARGLFFCMKYETIAMLKNGDAGGAIVNISSVAGLIADPDMIPYVGAKHAVTGMTKAGGIEYAERGIRINGIAPGFIKTEMTQFIVDNPELYAVFAGNNFQRRAGEPSEIAGVALFLASDLASFMNGVTIPVDAGQTVH